MNIFLNGEKTTKILLEIFFPGKKGQNMTFVGKKPEGLVRGARNLAYRNFRSCFEKKLENNKFLPAALHCEFDIPNTQIFCKYFHNLDQQKFLDSVFKGSVQLVLLILFPSFRQPVWIATDSLAIFTASENSFQLVPKYKLKVKLLRRKQPNIFIWNNSGLRKWEPRSSF